MEIKNIEKVISRGPKYYECSRCFLHSTTPRVYTCQCILLVCIESQVQLSSIGTPLVLELHHAESATRVVAASNPVADQYL